ADGDGWGAEVGGACFATWITRPGDCDDTDAAVFPGAEDICDGKQNDCDTPWSLADEQGRVTHVDDAGVTTDLTPAPGSDLALPSSGTVYVCGSEDAPVLATLHVDALDGALDILGISTGNGLATLDAGGTRTAVRVDENAGGTVTLVDLRITGGGRGDGGKGGGIWAGEGSELKLARCEIAGNAGVFGGVWAIGTLDMVGTTISGNTMQDADDVAEPVFYAGGLRTEGTAFVLDSIIRNNYSRQHGGGVHNAAGTLVLNNVLLVENYTDGEGAGLLVEGTTRLIGSMVAENATATDDHAGGGVHVTGGSLFCAEGSVVKANEGGDGAGVTLRSGAWMHASGCDVRENTRHDGTPAEIWAAGALWTQPAHTCFQCGGDDGCGEWSCPG
ncbi:MAG: MopE-related protein, partial [Myxococcota bacterium]